MPGSRRSRPSAWRRCAPRSAHGSTSAATAGSRTCGRAATAVDAGRHAAAPASRRRCSRRADDSGFIHAPSLTHAATAALLRNAHLGAERRAQPDGPFAIDLSSRRVRDAQRLLDGVRQGQPLGALLGYRFERRLHELRLDRFIAAAARARAAGRRQARADDRAARERSPPTTSSTAWCCARSGAIERGSCSVTGRCRNGRRDAGLRPRWHASSMRSARRSTRSSDALTAEAAYQMVRGNSSRTASTLAASRAAMRRRPSWRWRARRAPASRSRTACCCCSAASPARPPAGLAAPARRRAPAAEPMLNAWAAKLLGDPRKVRCTVEQLDEATGAVAETHADARATCSSHRSTWSTASTRSRAAGSSSERRATRAVPRCGTGPRGSRCRRACASSMHGRPTWRARS